MRRKQALILFVLPMMLLVSAFVLPTTHAALNWTIQPIPGNNTDAGFIALDANNNPHITYITSEGSHLTRVNYLLYASWNGSSWEPQTVATDYRSCGLVMDSNNNPHILCAQIGSSGLIYASWTGSNWTLQTVDEEGLTGSLALDSKGNPHIAYVAGDWPTNPNAVKYATYEGSGWSTQTLESTNDNLGNPQIAVDSNNTVKIMYESQIYDNHLLQFTSSKIQYAVLKNESGSLNFQTSTVLTNVTFGSMALDSNGYPHLTCVKGTDYGTLSYVSWNGKDWITQPIAENMSSFTYSLLALDSSNNPHIAYVDQSATLTYTSWNGNAWDNQTVNASKASVAQSMALDSYGNPHICYQTGIQNYGSLMYATAAEPNPTATSTPAPTRSAAETQTILITLTIAALAGGAIAIITYRKHRKKHEKPV